MVPTAPDVPPPLGWGIIASGKIAHTVGAVIRRTAGHRVAAVTSRDLNRARDFAAVLGDPTEAAPVHAYDDVAALLADPGVQAVYVATPHPQHVEPVLAALDAGVAVLCEKPLTAAHSDTERMLEHAKVTGTFLMEGMWNRFNPLTKLLVEQVEAGDLGDVRSVHATFGFVAPPDPTSRLWAAELGGGALLDLGVYVIDLARLILGEPAEIAATVTPASTGVDAEAAMLLTYPSGARALLEVSLVAQFPATATITGTAGVATLGPRFHAPLELTLTPSGDAPRTTTIADREAGYVGELHEVARCLTEGLSESPVMPLEESLATMRLLERVRALLPSPTS